MDERPRAPRSTLALMVAGLTLEATGLMAEHQQLQLGAIFVGAAVIFATGGAMVATWREQLHLQEVGVPTPPTGTVEQPREWLAETLDEVSALLAGLTAVRQQEVLDARVIGRWIHEEVAVGNVYREFVIGNRHPTARVRGTDVELTTGDPMILHFRERDQERVRRLSKDDRIAVSGRLFGYSDPGWTLKECELIRVVR
ncbi:MAG: hypothetical protein OXH69_03055 [Acidobacteria bacterium]|nr:hypothetical protein [Acidobacteriota bacterium]